jgi:hypothetical protein
MVNHPAAINPQCLIATLQTPWNWPQLAETMHEHPTPPLSVAMATKSKRLGQSATDYSPTHHLATGHVPTPSTNSPRRPWRRPTVRVTSTTPSRHAQRGQSAQSGRRVLARARPHSRCPAPTSTRHATVYPLPRPPCTLAACTDSDRHVFSRTPSEPEAPPTAPFHHRQPRPHR